MKNMKPEPVSTGGRRVKLSTNRPPEDIVDNNAAGIGRGKSGGPGKAGGRKMRSKGGHKGY